MNECMGMDGEMETTRPNFIGRVAIGLGPSNLIQQRNRFKRNFQFISKMFNSILNLVNILLDFRF